MISEKYVNMFTIRFGERAYADIRERANSRQKLTLLRSPGAARRERTAVTTAKGKGSVTMVNEAKNLGDAVVERKTETPLDAFRRSAGFQIMFVLHSGLEVGRAIDHLCASAEKYGAAIRAWHSIETAPTDGRSFLVASAAFGHVDRAFFLDRELVIVGGRYQATHWMPLPEPPRLLISDDTQHGQASETKQDDREV